MTLYPLKLKNSQKQFNERKAAPGNVKLIKHEVWRNQNITGDFDIWMSLSRELLQSSKQTFLNLKRLAILDNAHAAQGGQKKDKDLIPTKLFEFLKK